MKIHVINQEPLEVTYDQAKKIMDSIAKGAEIVFVGAEMVRSSAIAGVRNDTTGEITPPALWGSLSPEKLHAMREERREENGTGYERFQQMKNKLMRSKTI